MTLRRFAAIVATALVVMVVNVAISFLYMVVYSYVINPGHDIAYYQAHAQVSAPYSSIIAGMPLMFLGGRWIGGRWSPDAAVRSALGVWLVYAAIDLAIIIPAGHGRLIPLVIVSLLTKLAAAYLGGRVAQRRQALCG
jgi:ABC-type transport system involved in cytochrome c biogenesis permease subunit